MWHVSPQIFNGNTDSTTVKENSVASLPRAKFIRFQPTKSNDWPSLRVEVYGALKGGESRLSCSDRDAAAIMPENGAVRSKEVYDMRKLLRGVTVGAVAVQMKACCGLSASGHRRKPSTI